MPTPLSGVPWTAGIDDMTADIAARNEASIAELAPLLGVLEVGEASVPRWLLTGQVIAGSGALKLGFFTARKSETVTQVRSILSTAAAGLTLLRCGIYEVDEDGAGTLVASTVNDASLMNSGGVLVTKALEASFEKVAGQRLAVGWLGVGTTRPQLAGRSGIGAGLTAAPNAAEALAPRLGGQINSLADLPASFVDADLSPTNTYASIDLLP